jgi:ATP/maltotriose-dependent transcriptional regulator MalT/DNA-binding SARP family transcriptional activator
LPFPPCCTILFSLKHLISSHARPLRTSDLVNSRLLGDDLELRHTPISKITKPRLPKVFARTRLFRILDRSRRTPVTWITGPPGSGKTTLVASYLDSRKLSCLWYQVDDGDADISTFFYYTGQAAKKAAPRIKRTLPLLTPEYQFGIPAFTRRYFDDLFSRLKRPFVLVLDNYQDAPENSALHEMIMNGLSTLPEGVTAILISRAGPPPAFARMETNKIINVIGWEQLQLTPEETSGVLRLHRGRPLQKESLSQIYEKTRGWAAGVVLMEASQARGGGRIEPEAMEPGKLSDYFAGEIFNKISKETQDFLLKTAYLSRMTPRMAEAITGNCRAGQILAELNRRNYFTERHSGPEVSYQYHALFREFLERKAQHEYSEEVRIELQLVAAKLLEEAGRIEDLAELFTKVSDWKGLGSLVLVHAHSLTKQGRSHTVEDWLIRIPREIIEAQPWLLYWLGISLLHYRPKESAPLFERAYDLFNQADDAAGVFLSWSGVVDSIQLQFERVSRFDHWFKELQQDLKKYKGFPSLEIESQVALSMFAALNLRKPHHPDAMKWRERMLSLAQQRGNVNLQILAAFYASWHELWVGHSKKAVLIFLPFKKIVTTDQTTPLTQIMIKTHAAIYCCFHGLNEQCQRSVSEVLHKAETWGIHMWDYHALGIGMTSALNAGDTERAEKLLQRMEAGLPQSSEMDKSYYYYLASWYAIIMHDHSAAREYIKIGIESAERIECPFQIALAILAAAVIYHELKKYDESIRHFKRAWRIATEMNSPVSLFMCNLALAQFAVDREREAEGQNALRKAMAIGREQGYVNMYWWRPNVMVRLCTKALEHGIEVEYVRDLISKHDLVPAELPLYIDSWPWPIRIFTLGKFEVRKDDSPFAVSKKVQKKPLQLLKALVAAVGREVREDHLADMLWPDAEGDAAYKALWANIIRLRRLLGTADAIVIKEGRVTLDPRLCWVDAWAFEGMLDCSKFGVRSSELKGGKKKSAADIAVLEKALDLYKGPFLADDPEPWSVSLREKLRDKFLRSINVLGMHYEQSREYEKALAVYRRGIDVDDLAELYHQRVMSCYVRLGRHAEALAAYNRCKKTFAACGIQPSEETEALRDSLHRQK